MYHPSRLIAKEDVDLIRVHDRRNFAAAEFVVHHRLALTINAGAIVRGGVFALADANGSFRPATECRNGLARLASRLRDRSKFCDRSNDVLLIYFTY